MALFWLFFRLTGVLDSWLVAWASRSKSKLDMLVAPLAARSLRVILPIVGIIFALPVSRVDLERRVGFESQFRVDAERLNRNRDGQ